MAAKMLLPNPQFPVVRNRRDWNQSAISIWSVGFVQKKHGSAVILLFHAGGGLAQIVYFTLAWHPRGEFNIHSPMCGAANGHINLT
jgi:hypothetical protein